MGRLPTIERDALSDALTTKCAAVWYAFLAEEAYFEGDVATHDEFMSKAETLGRSPQGFLHSKQLEDKIKSYV
jgi:hypothetical protein